MKSNKVLYDYNILPKKYEKVLYPNRVEVIGDLDREFVKYLQDKYFEISIQDEGRTIKIFEI